MPGVVVRTLNPNPSHSVSREPHTNSSWARSFLYPKPIKRRADRPASIHFTLNTEWIIGLQLRWQSMVRDIVEALEHREPI